MAVETNNYLNHLCESIAGLLTNVVGESSFPLLRRSSQVQLTAPYQNSNDFHLCLVGKEIMEDDKGSFTASQPPDRVFVFRNPVRMRVSFTLVSWGLARNHALKAHDRLTSYFFDNRSVEAFLPESFKKFPALLERMQSKRAELNVREVATNLGSVSSSGNFEFGFDYTALYHSGNMLREESRVKSRVLEFNNNNDTHERSVL